jgi:hypothetical protein
MEWIKLNDKEPALSEECLFSHTAIKMLNGETMKPSVHSGYYFGGGVFKSWVDTRDKLVATHWMPLPEPPKI